MWKHKEIPRCKFCGEELNQDEEQADQTLCESCGEEEELNSNIYFMLKARGYSREAIFEVLRLFKE